MFPLGFPTVVSEPRSFVRKRLNWAAALGRGPCRSGRLRLGCLQGWSAVVTTVGKGSHPQLGRKGQPLAARLKRVATHDKAVKGSRPRPSRKGQHSLIRRLPESSSARPLTGATVPAHEQRRSMSVAGRKRVRVVR
ncbi:hypothetical protein BHE74_00044826 [Ensete ventricosum]|nr:hypothetical protein GW17_00008239 [Ensete ventricosum]RWW49057.1 hypothetical protein BHE74_00044826 [Ensete ventricosum]RZS18620.1 hypothetical protein BHM03_00050930 [Ensete ventricosum]